MTGGGPAPTPAQRRRAREREQARRTILDAALGLARTDGWDAVTMRRLGDALEYSANFAYRYFRGRDDILLALVRDGFAQLREVMVDAGAADPDPVAAVHRAARAYLAFALDRPELYRLMYGLGGVHVAAADAWREGAAVGEVLGDLLRTAGAADPEGPVLRLWATAHGLVALRAVGRVDLDRGAAAAVVDDAVRDVLRRVAGGPPGPSGTGAP